MTSHTTPDNPEEAERRLTQFRTEIATMKLKEPSASREALLLRLGVALMVAGIATGVGGYLLTSGTDNALDQRDGMVVAIIGIPVALVGVALYLRHGLTQILRLWMARAIFDQQPHPPATTTDPR